MIKLIQAFFQGRSARKSTYYPEKPIDILAYYSANGKASAEAILSLLEIPEVINLATIEEAETRVLPGMRIRESIHALMRQPKIILLFLSDGIEEDTTTFAGRVYHHIMSRGFFEEFSGKLIPILIDPAHEWPRGFSPYMRFDFRQSGQPEKFISTDVHRFAQRFYQDIIVDLL